MTIQKEIFFIAVIFTISFILRVTSLSSVPPGFHVDEVQAGYNAFSLLKTGQTLEGEYWPVYLHYFNQYRPLGQTYLMIPSIAVLGLNEFSTRLPEALIGSITPVFLYILVKKMSKSSTYALLSSIFIAFSFWHIVLSRATSEGILSVFLAVIITLLYFNLREKPKITSAIYLYLVMLVSFVSYHPINLFLILFIPAVSIFSKLTEKNPGRRFFTLIAAVYVMYLIFPLSVGFVSGKSIARYNQISILNGLNSQIQKQISEVPPKNYPVILTRIFHNKLISAGYSVVNNYSNYFSINYLLLNGGTPNRYKIPNTGLINVIELIGLVLSLFFLLTGKLRGKLSTTAQLFLMWLILAPLSSAITADDQPNVNRTIIMMPAIQVLASIGIISFLNLLKDNKLIIRGTIFVIVMVFVFHLGYFLDNYYLHEKYYEDYSRNYASREIAKKLAVFPKDKRILATTHLFDTDAYVLFFQKIDPRIAIKAYQKPDDDITYLNYHFTNKTDCVNYTDVKNLNYDVYVDLFYCDTPAWWHSSIIYQADGVPPAAKISERLPKPI